MENNIELLLRLLFVHIVCDFFFQNKKMVLAKQSEDKATKYCSIALHSSIHAALSYIAVMVWQCWTIPLVIFASHFIIDWIKSNCKTKGLLPFVIDQLLHLLVILGLWLVVFAKPALFYAELESLLNSQNIIITVIAYLLILKPASVALGLFFNRWNVEDELKGLPSAGKWIGYFERILILTFILASQIEMIGFLIAAKSIFRFGELKQTNEIKITEYILIGTFASFTIAISVGYIARLLFM